MTMSPRVLEYDNAISQEDLDLMLETARTSTEADWSKMDNEEETGPYWLGKRMMLDHLAIPSWYERIVGLRSDIEFTGLTEPNKIQRFRNQDRLGPLKDSEHEPAIKYGSILFLNAPGRSEIYFPRLNYKVKAEPNKLVVYPGNEQYIVWGSQTSEYLYFSTVFMN